MKWQQVITLCQHREFWLLLLMTNFPPNYLEVYTHFAVKCFTRDTYI